MRIGIDCRLWNETGVGRYIRNLVSNLLEIDKENQYVLFVLSKDKEQIKSQIPSLKSQVSRSRLHNVNKEIPDQVRNDNLVHIVEANSRWHSVGEQVKFCTILKRESLDLMHFPYFSVPIRYDRPFVITIHDLILHHFPTGEASHLPNPLYRTKLVAYRFVIQQAAKRARKIITVSNATKKEIVDHLHVSEKKVVVTYEGVEQIPSSKSQIPNNIGKYFLHVGNVYPHKNVDRLLKAFRLFREKSEISHYVRNDRVSVQNDKLEEVKLVFVGREDFFFKRLRQKVKDMELSDSVVFLGHVSESELVGLYEHAVATVVPSLMEGFGLPAVEAMANNCLVIASDIPSLHEVCGDAAVYADPFRSSDIAEKLQLVSQLSKGEREKKIEEGLEIVKKYSWRKMVEETLGVYKSVK